MSQLLGFVVNGLSLGAVYALIAIGFVMVFKATSIMNFAHGSVVTLGAYVVGRTHGALGFWWAALLGLAAAAAAAALIDVIVMRHARTADLGTLAILTIGVNTLLSTELTRRMGSTILSTGAPWGTSAAHLGGVSIPVTRIAAALVAFAVVTALWAAFRYTSWGVRTRAAAEDGDTAALMGIRLNRIAAGAWAVAGALAALAGIFLTSFPSPGITPAVGVTALAAIPAWVVGGFDSFPGAVVGGLVIGVVSALTAGYQQHLLFLGRDLAQVTPYAVMFLVLIVRPSGLFGTKEATRV